MFCSMYGACTGSLTKDVVQLQDIMNWYCTIRAARLKLLQKKYPSRPMEEV